MSTREVRAARQARPQRPPQAHQGAGVPPGQWRLRYLQGLTVVGVVNIAVMLLLVLAGSDLLWGAALVAWVNALMYALAKWRQRVYFAAFLGAYFVFLMGRETLVRLFDYGPPTAPEVNDHLALTILVGLVGVTIGHMLTSLPAAATGATTGTRPRAGKQESDPGRRARRDSFRVAATVLFWGTFPVLLYSAFQRVSTALSMGYEHLYDAGFRSAAASGVMALVGQVSLINSACFWALLATFPTRKQARWPVLGYLLGLVLALVSGERAPFMIGLTTLGCYAVARARLTPDEPWIGRRGLVWVGLLVPLLVLLMAWVEVFRGVGATFSGGPLRIIPDFFYQQGVSATVIVYAEVFRPFLPDQNYLLEFTHAGIIARLLGIPVIQGNSVLHALEGGSLSHSLGYVVLRDLYLQGRGTGSSFLAEAFLDGGYPGVFLVAVGYGVLLGVAARMLSPTNFVGSFFLLIILENLIWAPRASATLFITTATAPSTLAALLGVVLLGLIFDANRRRRDQNSGPGDRAGDDTRIAAA